MDRSKLIGELIESFHAIKHELMLDSNSFSGSAQITFSQLVVLRIASQFDGISIKEIAAKLSITSSAVTQLVDGLVKKGHLKREGSREDRRTLKICLSEQGKEKIHALRIKSLEKLVSIFDVFTDEELLKYCQLNRKIADKILKR
jgi:DNA-binding MarR family transcriptional regulator